MRIDKLINELENEWDQTQLDGFFGKLKLGEFDVAAFQKLKRLLNEIVFTDEEFLPRRLVELLWFIPTYMRWQRDSWVDKGLDVAALDTAIAYFEQRLTTILGTP
jgi:hypothetical protein